MTWSKIGKIAGVTYFSIYLAGMILPRNLNLAQLQSDNFLIRIYVDLLYVSGKLEILLNILLLVPVYIFLRSHFDKIRPLYLLYICLLLSISAEFLQSFIPGRVSSVQDVFLNSLGALFVYLFLKLRSRS